jgi:hypothetical protein
MNVPIFSLLPIAAAVHHPRSSSGDERQRIARWLQPTPERRHLQFLYVLHGARGVSQPRTMRTWCILLSSASGIGMPSPMGAAPSSAIDEPHAPRPVGSRQRCRSASSDSGRRSQSSATCAEYKGRDRALYPEDGTPGSTKPKAGLAITLIHGAGVHCPSPRIVTYSRPFAPMARPCDPEPPDHV